MCVIELNSKIFMSDKESFGGDNDSGFDDEEDYGSEAEILDE